MPLNWDLSAVFLMIGLGLWVFERKTTEVKGPSYPIIQGYLTWLGMSQFKIWIFMWNLISWDKLDLTVVGLHPDVTIICTEWELSPLDGLVHSGSQSHLPATIIGLTWLVSAGAQPHFCHQPNPTGFAKVLGKGAVPWESSRKGTSELYAAGFKGERGLLGVINFTPTVKSS